MFLERLKTTDFVPGKKYVFVVPMGSIEQHGPFLPLGTDAFLADKIVEMTEPSFPEFVFLPTLRITCSDEHEGFAGTVWLKKETMSAVLRDICDSLKPYARTIALTSFHGGNLAMIDQFVEEYGASTGDFSVMHVQMGSEATEERMRQLLAGPTDAHAGNVEISMMLATDARLADAPPTEYPKHYIEDAFSSGRIKDVSTDGIADNHPKWAVSKENGELMLSWVVEDIKSELRKIS